MPNDQHGPIVRTMHVMSTPHAVWWQQNNFSYSCIFWSEQKIIMDTQICCPMKHTFMLPYERFDVTPGVYHVLLRVSRSKVLTQIEKYCNIKTKKILLITQRRNKTPTKQYTCPYTIYPYIQYSTHNYRIQTIIQSKHRLMYLLNNRHTTKT